MDHRLKLVKYLLAANLLIESVDISKSSGVVAARFIDHVLALVKQTNLLGASNWNAEAHQPASKKTDIVKPDISVRKIVDGEEHPPIRIEAKVVQRPDDRGLEPGETDKMVGIYSKKSDELLKAYSIDIIEKINAEIERRKKLFDLGANHREAGSPQDPQHANDPHYQRGYEGKRTKPSYSANYDELGYSPEDEAAHRLSILRKSDIHIIKTPDETHVMVPYEENEIPEHIKEFLDHSGLKITHHLSDIQHLGGVRREGGDNPKRGASYRTAYKLKKPACSIREQGCRDNWKLLSQAHTQQHPEGIGNLEITARDNAARRAAANAARAAAQGN